MLAFWLAARPRRRRAYTATGRRGCADEQKQGQGMQRVVAGIKTPDYVWDGAWMEPGRRTRGLATVLGSLCDYAACPDLAV